MILLNIIKYLFQWKQTCFFSTKTALFNVI